LVESAVDNRFRSEIGEAEAVEGEGLVRSVDDRRLDLDGVARGGAVIADDGLHPEPGAALDDP
jgi:hypothetical protein